MLSRRLQKLERLLAKDDSGSVRIVIAFQQPDGTFQDRHTGESWENADACKASFGEEGHLILICVDNCMVADIVHKPEGINI